MMTSEYNDPKLLYAIQGVRGYHIQNGDEDSLTPSGPQTLSLLMVPTSLTSPPPVAADGATASATAGAGAHETQDFYLHMHLPPELDLPLPATTQIYHQPPTSYLIPRWDLGPDSGAFTRIEFPAVGSRPGVQEDVDTFETILAQCTSFLERARPPTQTPSQTPVQAAQTQPPPPASSATSKAAMAAGAGAGAGQGPAGPAGTGGEKGRGPAAAAVAAGTLSPSPPVYNPSSFGPGQGYAQGSHSLHRGGKIVLVDEEDGSVLGELGSDYQVLEDSAITPGSKEPVEVALPTDGSHNLTVQPVSQEYTEMDMHPAFKGSSLVSTASKASRLVVTTSDYVVKGLQTGADSFARSVKPAAKPMTFNPTTHDHIRRINRVSTKAAGISSSTVHAIGRMAQNIGATVSSRGGGANKDGAASGAYDRNGSPVAGYKPGVLNKSLMAFHTVVDGMEQAGKNLLNGTQHSVTSMVAHRWGAEAGEVSHHMLGGVKNVGLVYIDVTGVSRRAILKNVAKGMIVGKVANGGGSLIVGGGDGGTVMVPPEKTAGMAADGGSQPPLQLQAAHNEGHDQGQGLRSGQGQPLSQGPGPQSPRRQPPLQGVAADGGDRKPPAQYA